MAKPDSKNNYAKYGAAYFAEKVKAWREAHPERARTLNGRANRARSWRHEGLRTALLGRPKPVGCEVCGREDEPIVFDHCHVSGAARGWLCRSCNAALGLVRDNPEILEKLASYLRSKP